MCKCEDENMCVNMYNRPPLLEEPLAQTLSRKGEDVWTVASTAQGMHMVSGGRPSQKLGKPGLQPGVRIFVLRGVHIFCCPKCFLAA